MNSKIQYFPVNWKNGMAFSENHLSAEFLALTDSQRDAIALQVNSHNYGLVGGSYQTRTSGSFRDNINSDKVSISYCRAITQNGSRIEITDQEIAELNRPMSELISNADLSRSHFWYLLLIIDAFNRQPYGDIDEKEIPRRKPYTRPRYDLEFLSFDELKLDNLANAIPIAKFEFSASGLRKVDEYIPPCTRIDAYEQLLQKYESYDFYLNQIKDHSIKVTEKINYKRRADRDRNYLSDDIFELCNSYLNFFIDNYDDYRLLFKHQAPLTLLVFFASMARRLNHTLVTGVDKSHVLKYFNQYATSLSVSELNELFSSAYTQEYQHFDMTPALNAIDRLLYSLDEIFSALRDLDYRDLAPRNVVQEEGMIHQRQQRRYEEPKGGLRIKRPDSSSHLGDDLID